MPKVEESPIDVMRREQNTEIFNRARRFSVNPIANALGVLEFDNPATALGIRKVARPVTILARGTTVREVRAPYLEPRYVQRGSAGIVELPTDASGITAIHEYFHALGAGEVQAYLAPFLFAHSKGFTLKNDFKREVIEHENDLMSTLTSFISNFQESKNINTALEATFKQTVGRKYTLEDLHSLHGKILAAFALASGDPIEAYKTAAGLDAAKAYDLTEKLVTDERLVGKIQGALAARKEFFNKWRIFGRFRGLDQKINWIKTGSVQPKLLEIQRALKRYKLFR